MPKASARSFLSPRKGPTGKVRGNCLRSKRIPPTGHIKSGLRRWMPCPKSSQPIGCKGNQPPTTTNAAQSQKPILIRRHPIHTDPDSPDLPGVAQSSSLPPFQDGTISQILKKSHNKTKIYQEKQSPTSLSVPPDNPLAEEEVIDLIHSARMRNHSLFKQTLHCRTYRTCRLEGILIDEMSRCQRSRLSL